MKPHHQAIQESATSIDGIGEEYYAAFLPTQQLRTAFAEQWKNESHDFINMRHNEHRRAYGYKPNYLEEKAA